MIFVNRRRIKQNSGIVKDPTKYWYIEKYVYGKLKETIEVPLGTGTTFGTMDSGYSDDTFYGWSKSSTSTTRTFTAATTYKNTTTAVKNALDSENTLKIYAIYSYPSVETINSFIESRNSTAYSITFQSDGTAIFYGFHSTVSSGATSGTATTLKSDGTAPYAKIGSTYVTGTLNSTRNSATTVTGTYITKNVTSGQKVTVLGTSVGNQSGFQYMDLIGCVYNYTGTTTKYRVSSH